MPADVYSLNLDGSAMTRIADIKDDDPTVAWSPDGSKLAIFGVAALYVVDAKGGPTDKLVDQGGYGGLDWTHWGAADISTRAAPALIERRRSDGRCRRGQRRRA